MLVMANAPRLLPDRPTMFRARLVERTWHRPSFRRVRVEGPTLTEFDWQGGDHWFRFFVPTHAEQDFDLPSTAGGGSAWWPAYGQIPTSKRPHLSNYTVADFDRAAGSMLIDVVMHRHGDHWGGAVARWADEAAEGSEVGILDQGCLFNPPADTDAFVIVADETGWPGVRGILRGLTPEARGLVVVELPCEADHEDVEVPAGVRVERLVRAGDEAVSGAAALERLTELADPTPLGYGYAVGEQALATGARRLLHRREIPKQRIFFSGFWRR